MRYLQTIMMASGLAVGLAGSAMAQTPATPTAEKPAATAAPVAKPEKDKVSDADKRAKAADCSRQADAKKLHGTAREKFRATCKAS